MRTDSENFDDFNKAILEIDNELRRRDIPLHARSLHAIKEYAKKYQIDIPIPARGVRCKTDDYSSESVGAQILQWYEERYGERQYFYMGPGSVIVMLREDPWEIRLRLILGCVHLVINRDLKLYADSAKVTCDGVHPILNILETVCELPQVLAKSLSDGECAEIVECFNLGMESLSAIDRAKDFAYVPEAKSDVASAVRHILDIPPHYGQSKWSSAQAAEKMLKAFLKSKNVPFPLNHNIRELYRLAKANGMGQVEKSVIDVLQTRAAVRYGDEDVTLAAAVAAHKASLMLARMAANSLLYNRAPVVDIVKGINLAADRNGQLMVAKFDLGNQTKAFIIPSSIIKFILSTPHLVGENWPDNSRPPIETEDWDGAVTPMWKSLKIDESTDLVVLSPELNHGTVDGLGFEKHLWSLFVGWLLRFKNYLA